jgi:hypothetical protein
VFTNPGGGGMFNRVAAGPGNLLIAASDLSGIYVSRDRGVSWTPVGPAEGLPEAHASAIGFDPRNVGVVLIGTEAGIYRSTDGARRRRKLGELQSLEHDAELLGRHRRRDTQPGGRPGQRQCGLGHLRGSGPQPRVAEYGGRRAHELS